MCRGMERGSGRERESETLRGGKRETTCKKSRKRRERKREHRNAKNIETSLPLFYVCEYSRMMVYM
jgi:hypothetical protein